MGALAVVAAAALQLLRTTAPKESHERNALIGVAAGAVFYLCSVAIVTPFQHRTGQVLLSGFWGALGVGLLLAGLRTQVRALRLAGFGLLVLALAKVVLYDLAALASGYRVASLVAIGLLLLTASFAYQRLRTVQ